MSVEVICVGGATIDITAKVADVQKIAGQFLNFADDVTICVGGDALNEALSIAKLGHKVSLVTCIGNDLPGQMLVSEVKSKNIDVSHIRKEESVATSQIICITDQNDHRHFIFQNESAINRLNLGCIDLEAVKKAKALTFGSLLFCSSFPEEEIIYLFKTAQENKVLTIADIAVMDEKENNFEKIKRILPYIDYFFPNYEEASSVTGEKDPDKIADCFLKNGVKTVILKLGKDGCLAKSLNERVKISAYSVPVVNTTGAGDNFLAGFVSGVLTGYSLKGCLIRASATAAITVQSTGASTGVKNMEQVEAFIKENGIPEFEEERE